jgi:hypothetical protein
MTPAKYEASAVFNLLWISSRELQIGNKTFETVRSFQYLGNIISDTNNNNNNNNNNHNTNNNNNNNNKCVKRES